MGRGVLVNWLKESRRGSSVKKQNAASIAAIFWSRLPRKNYYAMELQFHPRVPSEQGIIGKLVPAQARWLQMLTQKTLPRPSANRAKPAADNQYITLHARHHFSQFLRVPVADQFVQFRFRGHASSVTVPVGQRLSMWTSPINFMKIILCIITAAALPSACNP